MIAVCPPWLLSLRDRLLAARRRGSRHHALLLEGPAGVGKRGLARSLATERLCLHPQADGACGHCPSCDLLQRQWELDTDVHPDYRELVPEKEGGSIGIDAGREIQEFVNRTASVNGHKVVLIHPLQALTLDAANALLKMLEEPAGDTSLILIGERLHRLPVTVLSRCLRVRIPVPAVADALPWLQQQTSESADTLRDWLRVCGGAPLLALEQGRDALTLEQTVVADLQALAARSSDPIKVAERWAKPAPRDCLLAFHRHALQRQAQALQQASPAASAWAETLMAVTDALRVLDQPQASNAQLLLESLLVACGSRLALE